MLFCLLLALVDFFLQFILRRSGQGFANFGISFGINFGGVQIVVVAILFLFLLVRKNESGLGWSMMLFGALSNLFNRLIYGSVWDYLSVGPLFFNLADMMIVSGMMLLLVKMFKTDGNTLAR